MGTRNRAIRKVNCQPGNWPVVGWKPASNGSHSKSVPSRNRVQLDRGKQVNGDPVSTAPSRGIMNCGSRARQWSRSLGTWTVPPVGSERGNRPSSVGDSRMVGTGDSVCSCLGESRDDDALRVNAELPRQGDGEPQPVDIRAGDLPVVEL